MAVAREAGVELDIDDFDRISSKTPLLADLKPGGRFVAADLYQAGGVALVAKRLLDAGILNGDEVTVTGRTVGEEAAEAREAPGQQVVRPLDDPLKETGGLVILRGNLAPEGCVVKVAGHERLEHRGPARVFECEEDAMAAVTGAQIREDDVIVIRNEGPERGSWDARDAGSHGSTCRGGSGRLGCVAHRRPLLGCNARANGRTRGTRGSTWRPIAAVREGDVITFDISARRLDVELSDEEIARRVAEWNPPQPVYTKGVMAKYARSVSSASRGAVTS